MLLTLEPLSKADLFFMSDAESLSVRRYTERQGYQSDTSYGLRQSTIIFQVCINTLQNP